MTARTLTGIGALLLAHTLAGCGGADSTLVPSAPTTATPTFTLSGMVTGTTATGRAPLEGVLIQLNMVKPVTTDSNGFYSIPGLTLNLNVSTGVFNTVTAWKPTYVNDTTTISIAGDTRFDIQMDRRPTFTLSGVVSELTAAGLVPVEGVEIHDWSCDPTFPGNRLPTPSDGCNYGVSHSTTTDRNGHYSVAGVYATKNLICATKEGYQATMPDSECDGYSGSPTLDGDTRLDIQLVRR